jgi:RNA polymerase sigma-70 factor (ECF subfamily)
MTAVESETSALIRRASEGDELAVKQLLAGHRVRLRQMVAVHMDTRLAARIDPSDVVQEAMLEASQKLPGYLKERPVSFYPWLRQIAWQHLVQLRRHHLLAGKRSVLREERWDLALPDESVVELANRLVSSGTSPSQRMIRNELRGRVRAALEAMSPNDRQVLILRHLEQLSTAEAAQVIGITEAALMKRHLRAVQRIRHLLDRPREDSP